MSKSTGKKLDKGLGAKTLKVTLSKSLLGRPERHRRVAKALGLTKLNRSVMHADTPIIRGMLNTIPHLLTVSTPTAMEGSV